VTAQEKVQINIYKNDLLILFTFCMVTDVFYPLIHNPAKRLKEMK